MQTGAFLALVVVATLNVVVLVLAVVKFVWEYPLMKRINLTLTLIEGHVQIDEGQRQRIVTAIQGIREEHRETRDTTREAAATVATEIKQAVAEVPEKVVEKIQEAGTGESGIHNRPRQ